MRRGPGGAHLHALHVRALIARRRCERDVADVAQHAVRPDGAAVRDLAARHHHGRHRHAPLLRGPPSQGGRQLGLRLRGALQVWAGGLPASSQQSEAEGESRGRAEAAQNANYALHRWRKITASIATNYTKETTDALMSFDHSSLCPQHLLNICVMYNETFLTPQKSASY